MKQMGDTLPLGHCYRGTTVYTLDSFGVKLKPVLSIFLCVKSIREVKMV